MVEIHLIYILGNLSLNIFMGQSVIYWGVITYSLQAIQLQFNIAALRKIKGKGKGPGMIRHLFGPIDRHFSDILQLTFYLVHSDM